MAKRKSIEDKRTQKRQALIDRTAIVMGVDAAVAEARLQVPLVQSVRINPLKGDIKDILMAMKELGWAGESVTWCENGYTITEGYEALRDSQLVVDGKIYIQNASSWLPVVALDPQPGESVLDICAAPGGKTSHIAALTSNHGRLVANDNSRPRLAKLRYNLSRMGAEAEYTLIDATRLASAMGGEQFDKILLDAPCSGEGLINLANLKTLDSWSVAHIRRLATLQKRLIDQAWQLLVPGGVLVYSTCTMAPEEDEAVIDYLLRRRDDAAIEAIDGELSLPLVSWNDKVFQPGVANARRVFPESGNEAFFVCKVRKDFTSLERMALEDH